MKFRKVLSFVLVLALFLSLGNVYTPRISAYVLKGVKIESLLGYVPYEGFGTASRAHMVLAATKWNDANSVRCITVLNATHSASTGFPALDGKNYIYRIDAGSGYVGLCATWCIDGVVTESDINLNMYYSWANSAQPGCYDVYTIILHEMGHAMGLGDVRSSDHNYNTTVMWYEVWTNSEKRSLKADDIAGLVAIYGS